MRSPKIIAAITLLAASLPIANAQTTASALSGDQVVERVSPSAVSILVGKGESPPTSAATLPHCASLQRGSRSCPSATPPVQHLAQWCLSYRMPSAYPGLRLQAS